MFLFPSVTYFMGAYLFEAEPPFAITHILPDPVIPQSAYNQSNGWAYKGIDYVVFPMSLHSVPSKDLLFLCFGRNDNSGWIAIFNQSALVADMMPVQSETKINNFETFVREWRKEGSHEVKESVQLN